MTPEQRLMDLCQQIKAEVDPERLTFLIHELNELIDTRVQALKAQSALLKNDSD